LELGYVLLEVAQVAEREAWLRLGEQSCVLLELVGSHQWQSGEQRLAVGCGAVGVVAALGGIACDEPTGGSHELVVVASWHVLEDGGVDDEGSKGEAGVGPISAGGGTNVSKRT